MQQVRLSESDLQQIKLLFKHSFGDNDHLWLFGSRADMTKRGGDIDLYIETRESNTAKAVDKRGKFWVALQDAIGEQKIDILLNVLALNSVLSIYNEAKTTGVKLV